MADTDDSISVSGGGGISRNTWILIGAVVVVAIVVVVVILVLVLPKKDDGDENGKVTSGPTDPLTTTSSSERQKYNIISPYTNEENIVAGSKDKYTLDECEHFAEEYEDEDEDVIGFSWNKWSWFNNNRPEGDPEAGLGACLVRRSSDTTCKTPEGGDTCEYANQFLFEKDSKDGIDIGEWDIQLGVRIKNFDGHSANTTLKKCAEDAAESDTQIGFAYRFGPHSSQSPGWCMILEEGQNYEWQIPYYPEYYPGAVFLKSQLDYHVITEESTTCEDLDMEFITDEEECMKAATKLGLDIEDEIAEAQSERPTGCYWTQNMNPPRLYLTERDPNELIGSKLWDGNDNESRLQICKKKGKS